MATWDDVRAVALALPGVVEETSWGRPWLVQAPKRVARVYLEQRSG